MIKANYVEMQTSAHNMINAGEEYKTNVGELYHIVDDLVEHWKGTDNLAFAQTANGYKADLTALGTVIEKYGKFLDTSAQSIRGTQEQIANNARRI